MGIRALRREGWGVEGPGPGEGAKAICAVRGVAWWYTCDLSTGETEEGRPQVLGYETTSKEQRNHQKSNSNPVFQCTGCLEAENQNDLSYSALAKSSACLQGLK